MFGSLPSDRLLQIWEQATSAPPAQKATVLLAAFANQPSAVNQLSVGERDRQLMHVRQRLLGNEIEGLATCPSCSAKVEISFLIANIAQRTECQSPQPLEHEGYEVHWRLPTCEDLAQLSLHGSPETVRRELLERTIQKITHQNIPIELHVCPPQILQRVGDAMSLSDPLADVRLEVSCPSCQHLWQVTFDIGTYFWSELDSWAKRILRDVHRLATNYGWSETDVLRMSTTRRDWYLNLVGA